MDWTFSPYNTQMMYLVMVFSFVFFQLFRWFLEYIGRKMIYPGIMKASTPLKIRDFEARIISNTHAFPCVVLGTIAYLTTPEYYRDHIMYHPHFFIGLIGCWDIGYMCNDLIFLTMTEIKARQEQKKSNKNKKHDPNSYYLYLFHHIVSGLSSYFSVFLVSEHLGCIVMLWMEFTGFFVNNIFLLPLFGLRDTIWYKLNALLILVLWIFFRFIVAIWYLRWVTWYGNDGRNWQEYYTDNNKFLFLWWEIMQAFFSILNLFWFYKIIMGFYRIVANKSIAIDKKKKEEKEE